MKTIHAIVLLFLLAGLSAYAFDSAELEATIHKQNVEEVIKRAEEIGGCMASEGVWRWMPDPCTGKCNFDSGQACISVLTMGCDCGLDRCFDEKTNTCK